MVSLTPAPDPLEGARAAAERSPAPGGGAELAFRRLSGADAAAIAALERIAYPTQMRPGARQLRSDLEDADWDASNVSYGMFAGAELVGALLVFYEPDCREVFPNFDLECPEGLNAEECLYVADFMVRREYSRFTLRLVREMRAALEPSFAVFPLYGFCAPDALARFESRRRALRGAGYRYGGKHLITIADAPHAVFLVRVEPVLSPEELAPPPGLVVETVTTMTGWNALEPDWNRLLHVTPDGAPFQTFELLKIWWKHLREPETWPLIVVVRDRGRVRAIAPFCIANTSYYGSRRRVVKFIGDHNEIDRPTVLRAGDDRRALELVFEKLLDQREQWDAIFLLEQPTGGDLPSIVEALMRRANMLHGALPGPLCPWLDTNGSWDEFLAGKSRNFRKNLKRKLKLLTKRGKVELKTFDTWPEVLRGFELYCEIEQRSWKPAGRVGVLKHRKTLQYHTALLHAFGPVRKLHFRVLFVDDRPVAATFGLLERRTFLSLHIAHDREFDAYSPGVSLTAYEVEEAFRRPEYGRYELLGGFLNNKTAWCTEAIQTQQVYAYRRDALFSAHYVWQFRIETRIKAVLRRMGWLEAVVRAKESVLRFLSKDDADDYGARPGVVVGRGPGRGRRFRGPRHRP